MANIVKYFGDSINLNISNWASNNTGVSYIALDNRVTLGTHTRYSGTGFTYTNNAGFIKFTLNPNTDTSTATRTLTLSSPTFDANGVKEEFPSFLNTYWSGKTGAVSKLLTQYDYAYWYTYYTNLNATGGTIWTDDPSSAHIGIELTDRNSTTSTSPTGGRTISYSCNTTGVSIDANGNISFDENYTSGSTIPVTVSLNNTGASNANALTSNVNVTAKVPVTSFTTALNKEVMWDTETANVIVSNILPANHTNAYSITYSANNGIIGTDGSFTYTDLEDQSKECIITTTIDLNDPNRTYPTSYKTITVWNSLESINSTETTYLHPVKTPNPKVVEFTTTPKESLLKPGYTFTYAFTLDTSAASIDETTGVITFNSAASVNKVVSAAVDVTNKYGLVTLAGASSATKVTKTLPYYIVNDVTAINVDGLTGNVYESDPGSNYEITYTTTGFFNGNAYVSSWDNTAITVANEFGDLVLPEEQVTNTSVTIANGKITGQITGEAVKITLVAKCGYGSTHTEQKIFTIKSNGQVVSSVIEINFGDAIVNHQFRTMPMSSTTLNKDTYEISAEVTINDAKVTEGISTLLSAESKTAAGFKVQEGFLTLDTIIPDINNLSGNYTTILGVITKRNADWAQVENLVIDLFAGPVNSDKDKHQIASITIKPLQIIIS